MKKLITPLESMVITIAGGVLTILVFGFWESLPNYVVISVACVTGTVMLTGITFLILAFGASSKD